MTSSVTGSTLARSAALIIYLFAMATTGGLTGAVFSIIGEQLNFGAYQGPFGALIAVMLFSFALKELGWLSLPLPSAPWQVPRTWVAGSAWSRALVWGMLLGPGFLTRQSSSMYHAMLLWALLAADVSYGLVLGASFALVRALPVALVACAPQQAMALSSSLLFPMPLFIRRVEGLLLASASISLFVVLSLE